VSKQRPEKTFKKKIDLDCGAMASVVKTFRSIVVVIKQVFFYQLVKSPTHEYERLLVIRAKGGFRRKSPTGGRMKCRVSSD
jgi:hypothetical protein